MNKYVDIGWWVAPTILVTYLLLVGVILGCAPPLAWRSSLPPSQNLALESRFYGLVFQVIAFNK